MSDAGRHGPIVRAVGMRKTAEGDEGGGAEWDMTSTVSVDDKQVLIADHDDRRERTHLTHIPLEDIESVELRTCGGSCRGSISFRPRKKRWWDVLLKWPTKVQFEKDQEEQFVKLVEEVRKRIHR